MSLTFANQTASGSGTNLSSYSTASISPATGGLLLIAVVTQMGVGTPTKPTISGLSGTWTEIIDCNFDQAGTTYRLTAFRCTNYTGTGALTIDYGGTLQAGASWTVDLVTGATLTNPIVQSAKTAEPGSAGTSVSPTLATAIKSGNGAWAVAAWEANEAGSSEAGWTTLGDAGNLNPSAQIHSMGNTGSSDNSGTISWTTSTVNGGIILEIQAALIAAVGSFAEGGQAALFSIRQTSDVGSFS